MIFLKTVSLFLFLFFSSLTVFSQPIQYTYDQTGNRIKKEIDISPGQLRKKTVFKDQVGGAELKIYPNPTTEFLTVEVQEVSDAQTSMEVIDMNGRIIWQSNQLRSNNKIDFTSYAKGKYILQITNGQKRSNWVIIKN